MEFVAIGITLLAQLVGIVWGAARLTGSVEHLTASVQALADLPERIARVEDRVGIPPNHWSHAS